MTQPTTTTTTTTTPTARKSSAGPVIQSRSATRRRRACHRDGVLYQASSSECNSECNSDTAPLPDAGRQQQQQQQQLAATQLLQAQIAEFPPTMVDPFPQAADPMYTVQGPVGMNHFIVSRYGDPTAEELSNENILKILIRGSNVYNNNNNDDGGSSSSSGSGSGGMDGTTATATNSICVTDLEVNTLVWKCLGYRFDPIKGVWTPEKVFPKWKERFPAPPDLIGMERIYSSKAIDGTILKNNQHLVRSVPTEYKQGLRTHLRPMGFRGYKLSELTPNLTRRAQCSNWLLYYRDELFGVTLEELQERRQLKQQQQATPGEEDGIVTPKWTPPVKEVF
jgi:hypothetical protein